MSFVQSSLNRSRRCLVLLDLRSSQKRRWSAWMCWGCSLWSWCISHMESLFFEIWVRWKVFISFVWLMVAIDWPTCCASWLFLLLTSLSRNVILRRVAANFLILCLLASSIYAVILVNKLKQFAKLLPGWSPSLSHSLWIFCGASKNLPIGLKFGSVVVNKDLYRQPSCGIQE